MQQTTGDWSCQTFSHMLKILCMVWVRDSTWVWGYRLLCNDWFCVDVNMTWIWTCPQYSWKSGNQYSQEQRYEAAANRAQRSHSRNKAAVFWVCVQQQWEKFWADVLQNFDDSRLNFISCPSVITWTIVCSSTPGSICVKGVMETMIKYRRYKTITKYNDVFAVIIFTGFQINLVLLVQRSVKPE